MQTTKLWCPNCSPSAGSLLDHNSGVNEAGNITFQHVACLNVIDTGMYARTVNVPMVDLWIQQNNMEQCARNGLHHVTEWYR